MIQDDSNKDGRDGGGEGPGTRDRGGTRDERGARGGGGGGGAGRGGKR